MTKKTIILSLVGISILFFVSQNMVSAAMTSFSSTNPEKLFSVGIGTASTTDSEANIGIFLDDLTASTYNTFYFPPAFSVDKDSNTLVVLDSIRNRLAIFSMDGQYKGEVKLPFNLPAKDFAWFPKNGTMIFIFNDSPDIGVLNLNTTSDMSIKSSSAFVVPEASSANTAITNIWPIDVATSSAENYFVLNTQGESSSLIFAEASNSVSELSNKQSISGAIGAQDKAGIVGYTSNVNSLLAFDDLYTNQTSQLSISTSTSGILNDVDGNALSSLGLVGTDEDGNIYIRATYVSPTIEGTDSSVVYKIDQTGNVKSVTEVFPSPQMLSNRYLFVDQYGSIFYMRADDKNTISFYEFVVNIATSTSVAFSSTTTNNFLSVLNAIPMIWLLGLGILILIIVVLIVALAIHHSGKKKNNQEKEPPLPPPPPPTPTNTVGGM